MHKFQCSTLRQRVGCFYMPEYPEDGGEIVSMYWIQKYECSSCHGKNGRVESTISCSL